MASSTLSLQELTREHVVAKYATISSIEPLGIAICTVTAAYIPMAEFEKLLKTTGELIKRERLTKFIFDKRNLTAFHMPSMEWYHLNWKEDMYQFGLVSHRKLLPDDKMFERNVTEGRKRIMRENPWYDFNKYDIVYCQTMAEAIEN